MERFVKDIPFPAMIDSVVFDFDSTLFDTEKKKLGFYEIAECHGYTLDEAKDMYYRSRAQGNRMMISIAGFLSVLREDLARDNKQFLSREVSIIIDRMNKGTGLLSGAKSLLEFCKKYGAQRCLVSLGVREWQEEKVQKSGVDNYFNKEDIIYTDVLDTGKIDIIREKFGEYCDGTGIVIFNDKPDETADILREFPKMFAYVRREIRDDRYADDDFEAFRKKFPDRFVYSEDLNALRGYFQAAWERRLRGIEARNHTVKSNFDAAFIDFDDTLYDTNAMAGDMNKVFAEYGVKDEDFNNTFLLAVHGDSMQYYNYTFELHLDILSGLGYDLPRREILGRLRGLIEQSYQYSDAEKFLSFVKERSKKTILLTAGNEKFQRERLNATNLARYFDDVVIIKEKKELAVSAVSDKKSESLFVNDDLPQNIIVKKRFPNFTVVTKRHPVKYSEEELIASGIPYFSKLSDIMSYVERKISQAS